jgi:molybdate transport system regulatory protein
MKLLDITAIEPFLMPAGRTSSAIGPRLLEGLVRLGSLHDVATSLGVEEDLAWNYLVAANNLSDSPLVKPLAETLTPTLHGRRLLGRSEDMTSAFQSFLDAPGGGAFRQFQMRHQFLQRLGARTSARNQFYCRVLSVRRERVNAVVMLGLGGGDQLAAHITAHSAEELALVGGRCCHALIDPGWVEVRSGTQSEETMRHNCLHGKVVRLLDDPVDAEVAIELAGGRIVLAAMTQAEMTEKHIRVGEPVCAVIQSSQIILAVDQPPASR